MKNDMFPRTLSRGILRGQTFETQADYAKALREAKQGTLNGRRIVTKSGKARCAKCGEWKPRTAFYPARKALSGLQSYCIACTKGIKKRSVKTKGQPKVVVRRIETATITLEVIKPDGTIIKADVPATEAARILGV